MRPLRDLKKLAGKEVQILISTIAAMFVAIREVNYRILLSLPLRNERETNDDLSLPRQVSPLFLQRPVLVSRRNTKYLSGSLIKLWLNYSVGCTRFMVSKVQTTLPIV
jgi:hypothetical protein